MKFIKIFILSTCFFFLTAPIPSDHLYSPAWKQHKYLKYIAKPWKVSYENEVLLMQSYCLESQNWLQSYGHSRDIFFFFFVDRQWELRPGIPSDKLTEICPFPNAIIRLHFEWKMPLGPSYGAGWRKTTAEPIFCIFWISTLLWSRYVISL